jgi:hypothetical protein
MPLEFSSPPIYLDLFHLHTAPISLAKFAFGLFRMNQLITQLHKCFGFIHSTKQNRKQSTRGSSPGWTGAGSGQLLDAGGVGAPTRLALRPRVLAEREYPAEEEVLHHRELLKDSEHHSAVVPVGERWKNTKKGLNIYKQGGIEPTSDFKQKILAAEEALWKI